MKNPNFPKAVALIIAVIGIFLILINSVEQPIVEEPIEVPAEIHALGEELIEEETKVEEVVEEVKEEVPIEEEVTEVIEKPVVKTFISNEKCEDGIISLNLNNLFNDTINVKWSTFFISGKININPGCDKESLEPGESTFCNNVGVFPRKGLRRVAIAIYKHTTIGVTVDCGTNLLTGSAVEEPIYYGFSPLFFIAMLFLFLFTFNYYRVHY